MRRTLVAFSCLAPKDRGAIFSCNEIAEPVSARDSVAILRAEIVHQSWPRQAPILPYGGRQRFYVYHSSLA